ncbi:MAG TPA: hypothetical protein VJN48_08200 [Terriglobales bacterium]|nr:hypothetical protein [Terriglobales bacterium]
MFPTAAWFEVPLAIAASAWFNGLLRAEAAGRHDEKRRLDEEQRKAEAQAEAAWAQFPQFESYRGPPQAK